MSVLPDHEAAVDPEDTTPVTIVEVTRNATASPISRARWGGDAAGSRPGGRSFLLGVEVG